MEKCIILQASDKAEIDRISSTSPLAKLVPTALVDGTYVLPPAVLDASEFAPQHDLLAALPQRDVDLSEYQWFANAAKQGVP